ncbi:MAG: methyltransferase domain-containing protein [Candidatus Diapherotrites archaeon]|nr:methyltransferase domain-containing protein [Candidatus Diapherotrites archaeon]
MNFLSEWVEDFIWVEVEHERLYPPENVTKPIGAFELTKGIDFNKKKVLDVGCGTGWFGRQLKAKGAEVIGVDVSSSLISEAEKSFKVINASVYKLPFSDSEFDFVCFFMVAHILEDPAAAFSEISRVLKSGGKVFFAIVHPRAENWNIDSGECFMDFLSYGVSSERAWIFNLTDGRKFVKHYFHRPLAFYEKVISEKFKIVRFLEPLFPKSLQKGKKYASREYLFMEIEKK